MKKEISVYVHYQALSCSVTERDDVPKLSKRIPGFKFWTDVTQLRGKSHRIDKVDAMFLQWFFEKYTDLNSFRHKVTGNLLGILRPRRKTGSPISPLILSFGAPNFGPISCEEVFPVRDHLLRKHNLHLQPDEVVLIVAIRAPKGTGIHEMVVKSIVPGETWQPYSRLGENCWVSDRRNSPSRLSVFGLAKELPFGLEADLKHDFCIIKLLFRLAGLKGMPTTLEELALHDWSHVYGKCFSLLEPTELLKKHDGYKTMTNAPISELQRFMETRHGIPPSDFYRDYVQDHPLLTDLVRDALAAYRWCPDYQE
jgi:hypothetical protein